MHKLGKKIDKWLKSLDKDELDIDMLSDGKEEGIICEQKEEKTVEERRDDHQGKFIHKIKRRNFCQNEDWDWLHQGILLDRIN
jgi:hypothetical protein